MDQASPEMPEKTQKPQNDKDYKYSPKHRFIFGWFFLQGLCVANGQKIKSEIRSGIQRQNCTPARRLKIFQHG